MTNFKLHGWKHRKNHHYVYAFDWTVWSIGWSWLDIYNEMGDLYVPIQRCKYSDMHGQSFKE